MTEKSVSLSQVGWRPGSVSSTQCSPSHLWWYWTGSAWKKQIVLSMGSLIDLAQDLLNSPSELLSNVGPPGWASASTALDICANIRNLSLPFFSTHRNILISYLRWEKGKEFEVGQMCNCWFCSSSVKKYILLLIHTIWKAKPLLKCFRTHVLFNCLEFMVAVWESHKHIQS